AAPRLGGASQAPLLRTAADVGQELHPPRLAGLEVAGFEEFGAATHHEVAARQAQRAAERPAAVVADAQRQQVDGVFGRLAVEAPAVLLDLELGPCRCRQAG